MNLKFTGKLCVMRMKNDGDEDLRNLTNLTWALKNFKNCTLMGSLWPNYTMFELKKYRWFMFDGTEYWYKFWWKTDFCIQKWQEKFGKFSPEHSKVSKLGHW